ncbi:unnamed protein product [Kluyveromyces dobzhanskii CBS 2104]|uniref:WGS project CCBQ000000000 data, contig 00012 n=1 Tax=Kluyveromyces dobzhanskii CBS 2104 TaxID=1427455 RepID=A0A0A8L350_9SACH|nr:unnamed protein product [Kluyveromyces dobzhanskii CBS 2104]
MTTEKSDGYVETLEEVHSSSRKDNEKNKNFFLNLKESFNLTMTLSALLLVSSSFSHGFDNQGFATIQAMDSFIEKFGEYDALTGLYSIPPKFLSYLNSFQYLGFAFGLICGSLISSRFGRKICVLSMSLYALIPATIGLTSGSKEQILCARVFNYIFIGMEMAVIPVFQAEIVPPNTRGFFVGAFQLSLNIGGLVIHIITNSTAHIENTSAWRIPLGLYYIFPSIIASLVMFIPESPRWLILKGKKEEAMKSLVRLRTGTIHENDISKEYESIVKSVEAEKLQKSQYSELFTGTNKRRTIMVILANTFQQVTGQAFSSQYGTIFIKSLNTVNPFLMSIVSSVIGIVAVIIVLIFTDQFGRKRFLVVGSTIQAIALLTMGGLGTGAVTVAKKKGVVATMMIKNFSYCLSWAPLSYVISSEIPTPRLRDKTYAVGILFNILFAFLTAFTLPYLLSAPYANLQSKVGFVYGGFTVLSIVYSYFLPECRGLSLEEIEFNFVNGVPLNRFKKMPAVEEKHREV